MYHRFFFKLQKEKRATVSIVSYFSLVEELLYCTVLVLYLVLKNFNKQKNSHAAVIRVHETDKAAIDRRPALVFYSRHVTDDGLTFLATRLSERVHAGRPRRCSCRCHILSCLSWKITTGRATQINERTNKKKLITII